MGGTCRPSRGPSQGAGGLSPKCPPLVTGLDVLDWKLYSSLIGLLPCRQSDDLESINWKDFMGIRVRKNNPEKIFLKMSYLDADFSAVTLATGRRQSISQEIRGCAYEGSSCPTLSEEKYQDLMKLLEGTLSSNTMIMPSSIDNYHSSGPFLTYDATQKETLLRPYPWKVYKTQDTCL